MIIVSVIGILLAFGVLIFAAYRKISMFLAAVVAAAIVALFGGLDVAAELVGSEGSYLIGMKMCIRDRHIDVGRKYRADNSKVKRRIIQDVYKRQMQCM